MELIQSYFSTLSNKQLQQLDQYSVLLKEWNQKINLISRKNEEAIEEQHILHALSIAKFIQFLPFSDVLDLGTGGGLPGIPLAILFPQTHFHLVDSIGKKINVVQDISTRLGLENVSTEHQRVEKLKNSYDFVVTRAVAQSVQLVNWTRHLFNDYNEHEMNNGIIALKGGDLTEELAQLNRPYRSIKLTQYYSEPFFDTKKLVYIPMKKSKKSKA